MEKMKTAVCMHLYGLVASAALQGASSLRCCLKKGSVDSAAEAGFKEVFKEQRHKSVILL